jgi:hypothetical protein
MFCCRKYPPSLILIAQKALRCDWGHQLTKGSQQQAPEKTSLTNLATAWLGNLFGLP